MLRNALFLAINLIPNSYWFGCSSQCGLNVYDDNVMPLCAFSVWNCVIVVIQLNKTDVGNRRVCHVTTRACGWMMSAAQSASVCPSDEDSQTFYVNASNGDSFRLKGMYTLKGASCVTCGATL